MTPVPYIQLVTSVPRVHFCSEEFATKYVLRAISVLPAYVLVKYYLIASFPNDSLKIRKNAIPHVKNVPVLPRRAQAVPPANSYTILHATPAAQQAHILVEQTVLV